MKSVDWWKCCRTIRLLFLSPALSLKKRKIHNITGERRIIFRITIGSAIHLTVNNCLIQPFETPNEMNEFVVFSYFFCINRMWLSFSSTRETIVSGFGRSASSITPSSDAPFKNDPGNGDQRWSQKAPLFGKRTPFDVRNYFQHH